MPQLIINNGTFDNDLSAESIRAAFTKCKSNFAELYGRQQNVLEYGAVGDGTYTSSTSGTNDTAAFQAAIDAAVADGAGSGVVIVPGNRTYRCDTLTIPLGIEFVGLGGRNGQGTASPPTIVYGGSGGGSTCMLDIPTSTQNIPATVIRNITLAGGSTHPNMMIRFRGTGGGLGSIDSSTYIANIWFQGCTGNALSIEGGSAGGVCTNFHLTSCRWDDVDGYGIYVNLGTDRAAQFTIDGHSTWTNNVGAAGGFMFLDGESATSGAGSIVEIHGLHTEVDENLTETYAGGTNPYDKRGVIRLGVNASVGNLQHRVTCMGLKHTSASGTASHSVFQVTASSGTDDANSRQVSVIVLSGNTLTLGSTDAGSTDQVGFIGGRVPYAERPPRGCARQGLMMFGIGRDSAGDHVQSWINSRAFTIRGLAFDRCTFANLPTNTWMDISTVLTMTDHSSLPARNDTVSAGGGSVEWPVFWNGTQWKAL